MLSNINASLYVHLQTGFSASSGEGEPRRNQEIGARPVPSA